jgi:hypothetical protein
MGCIILQRIILEEIEAEQQCVVSQQFLPALKI